MLIEEITPKYPKLDTKVLDFHLTLLKGIQTSEHIISSQDCCAIYNTK